MVVQLFQNTAADSCMVRIARIWRYIKFGVVVLMRVKYRPRSSGGAILSCFVAALVNISGGGAL